MLFTSRFCFLGNVSLNVCITTFNSKIVGLEIGRTKEEALTEAMLRFQHLKIDKQINLDYEQLNIETINLISKAKYAVDHLSEQDVADDIDFVVGTDFQRQVWKAICETKIGETISYKELAERVGKPKAVRAVASACGQNPLAILVPCHRVIKSNEELGRYHWGIVLKKNILDREQFLKPINYAEVDKRLTETQTTLAEMECNLKNAIANAQALLEK
jgi:O-6-methylguanine DNA methyltransferase